jgi:2',3'-cyclic-nucleotide 2'-phosphodiesterase/3'-nucleotidase/5'-nucleotidase
MQRVPPAEVAGAVLEAQTIWNQPELQKTGNSMNIKSLKNGSSVAWTALILALATWQASGAAEKMIGLTPIGSYASGHFNASAAETVAHDPVTQWLYVVNSTNRTVDVLSITDPTQPTKLGSINLVQVPPTQYGTPRGLAVQDGIVAVSFEATPKTSLGVVAFLVAVLDTSLPPGQQITVPDLRQVTVGALPDMITFTPNGRFLLVANEGEPNTYNDVGANTNGPSIDPEGSVSIINLSGGVSALTQADVRTAVFTNFNHRTAELRAAGVRIYGPNATVAQDLEPEYIAVAQNSQTAWVTLQENNAVATIDIVTAEVTEILPLGYKDHSLTNNGFGISNALDASDQDGANKIVNWPVKGMYQPDGIAAYSFLGENYLVMANEGDVRSVLGLLPPPSSGSEDIRVGSADYVLNPALYSGAMISFLKQNTNLGRLQTSRITGDLDGDGKYDEIHVFGGRSFSIRKASGELVFDSGDQFEQATAAFHPLNFNANNSNNGRDTRSDDSGPEPECLVLGHAFGRQFAFIGLERIGGIMIYDVTNPHQTRFVNYVNNRNFGVTPSAANIPPRLAPNTGDLCPEAILFIKEENSPNGKPLLVVTHEVSGTTTVFEITKE